MNITSRNTPKINCRPITRRRIVLLAGLLIVTGYALMTGPDSTGQTFCLDLFSARRIVLAPIMCLCGYLLVIVGILRKT